MADTGSRPTTVEGYAALNLRRQIDRIADQLADLAESVRRAGATVEQVGQLGRDHYANVVRDIVNEVGNTLPNLSLGSLSTTAATADIARATGE